MTDQWHGGKGSRPRPTDQKKYSDNWEKIFGKNKSNDYLDAYNDERLVSKFDKEEKKK